jgi:hypothetical protein
MLGCELELIHVHSRNSRILTASKWPMIAWQISFEKCQKVKTMSGNELLKRVRNFPFFMIHLTDLESVHVCHLEICRAKMLSRCEIGPNCPISRVWNAKEYLPMRLRKQGEDSSIASSGMAPALSRVMGVDLGTPESASLFDHFIGSDALIQLRVMDLICLVQVLWVSAQRSALKSQT